MKPSSMPSAALVRELLNYDPATGIFTWRSRTANCRQIGDAAGGVHALTGYRLIRVGGKKHCAHRLAWLYVTGCPPDNMIDHLNGVRDDNRFQNLRDVSRSINMQNQRHAAAHNHSTGVLGVSATGRKRNPYGAKIRVSGVLLTIGSYPTVEQASAAYLQAKRKLHEGCTI